MIENSQAKYFQVKATWYMSFIFEEAKYKNF